MKILSKIIGIFILLVAILFQLEYLNAIIKTLVKIKPLTYILLLLGFIFFLGNFLIPQFKIILKKLLKLQSNLISNRYFITQFSILIIILRMFFKQLNIDNLSLSLLIIAILNIFFPDFKQLILRINKIKKGDFELELSNLAKSISNFEENYESNSNSEYSNPKEIQEKITKASENPKALILLTASEIETKLRKLCLDNNLIQENSFVPINRMADILYEKQLISKKILPILKEFRIVRNRIAHEAHYEISDSRLFEFAELGLRILQVIPSKT